MGRGVFSQGDTMPDFTLSGTVIANTQVSVGGATVPTSTVSDWLTVKTDPTDVANIATNGVGLNGNIPDVYTSIPFIRQQGIGTNVRVRLSHAVGVASTTSLKYVLLGRKNAYDANTQTYWEILPNINGDSECTLTAATTDLKDSGASASHTTCSWTLHTHDCGGCDEFILYFTQALVMSDASEGTARVQVKIV